MEKGTQSMLAGWGGVVLLLVGLIGFFSDPVLGIFSVGGVHNFVHILSGVIGIWAGFWGGSMAAKNFNKWFGAVYLLVAVLGFLGVGFVVSLLNLNGADNLLHVALGLVFAGVGFFAE